MKAYRISLLCLLGAICAVLAWLAYVGVILLRYGIAMPVLSPRMWACFLCVPAMAGSVVGLLYPAWQRLTKLTSSEQAALLLWLIAAVVVMPAQFLVVGWREAVIAPFRLDFLLWLFCAVLAGMSFHRLRVLSGDTKRAQAEALGWLRHTLRFEPEVTEKVLGIALVFDLQGFSAFFNQPWAKSSTPRYLDLVFSAVTTELFGGRRFWGDKASVGHFPHPVHQKFLGDGMLYIWTPPSGKDRFSDDFAAELTRRLCGFREQFPLINEACKGPIPYTFTLPERIRFGLAGGLMYELARKDSSEKEYMGFCINLASRLQGYCPGLGLVLSAGLQLPEATMKKLDLIRVVATNIKGFEKEEVLVCRDEYESLSDIRRSGHFLADLPDS